jgi:hypothetical protein
MSKRLSDDAFAAIEYNCRGKPVRALVWSTRVLWYAVDKKRLVTLTIVRDPSGICPDDFFVTDDAEATDAEIVARYSGRWAIEVTNREVKQCLGAEDPQSWKYAGPERAANLSLWLYSAIVDVAHHHVRHSSHVDAASVVSEKADPIVPRRSRSPSPHTVGRAN